MSRVDNLDKGSLLKVPNPIQANKIPFFVTYNPSLPNVKNANKHWYKLIL